MSTHVSEPKTPEGYEDVCSLDELPARGKKMVQISGVSVLIVACDEGLFAIEDRCPQTGRSLAHGEVLDAAITSPHSGAQYDLKTGRYLGGGQWSLQSHLLIVFPLRVIEDRVYIRLPKL
jgi:nitrite reductase/ring-hydroxylating ferredoxin subunit